MENVIIGKGNLDGKGIYANRDFKKGKIVIKYNLRPITEQEFKNLPEKEKQFIHSHRGVIYLYLEPERYVNHSGNPNTYQDFISQSDVSLRDISKGEMITTDATKDDF